MKKFVCLAVLLPFILGGCQSKRSFSFDIQTRRVTIITEPSGATVTQINPMGQGSSGLGTTPIADRSVVVVSKITKMKNLSYHQTQQIMEQVGNVVVRIEKEGYQPYSGSLKTDSNETIVHTIELTPIEETEEEM